MTKAKGSSVVTDKQARKTALVVAAVLLGIAAWSSYRGRALVVAVSGGFAAALVLAGFALPGFTSRFHRRWMKLAAALGYVNSRILLGLIFYGVFTPYGFVSRLVGRDPLRRRGAQGESYWATRKNTRQAREQFERLF